MGDHRWWVCDLSEFQARLPGLELEFGIDDVLQRDPRRQRGALGRGRRPRLSAGPPGA